MFSTIDPELNELARLSARIGKASALVQGAGGNTSLKIEDELWVKASGTWLSRAEDEQIFTPVRLSETRRGIEAGIADPVTPAFLAERAPAGKRPSIETTLHALLPHRVVVHVHSVATIALAARADPLPALGKRLDGLAWAFAPYARPGLPLTLAAAAALEPRAADVLILGNHGLVVGAASCEAAAALLNEVERRLAAPARASPPPDLAFLKNWTTGAPYRLPQSAACHVIATNADNCVFAEDGALYPDHVVFLGPGVVALDPEQTPPHGPESALPPMLAVRGKGVVVRRDLSAAAEAMVECLAAVLPLIPTDAALNYLTPAQCAELLNWDAEKLRQKLNQ